MPPPPRSIHARRPPPPPRPAPHPRLHARRPPPPSTSFLHARRRAFASFHHARLRALAYMPGGHPLPPRPSSRPGAAPSPPRPAGAPLPEPPRAVAAAGGSRIWGLRVRDAVLPAASGPLQLPGGGGGVLQAAVPGGPCRRVGRPRRAHLLLLRQRGRHHLVRRQLRPRLGRCLCFSALVVFAEHRYYGEFLPFGSKDKAYNNSKSLAYLTAEQALAENAVLLTELKRNLSAEGSPVVLFGGSYGGMLAAWMRLKYLHITVGALASSAPILQFEDIVPSTIFYDLVSDDFKRESVSCFQTIKDSWKALDEQGNSQDGLLKLSKTFHLCQLVELGIQLSGHGGLPNAVRLSQRPANPIKEVCRNIDNQPEGTSTLERIYAGVNVYYNYTGTVDCFDLDDDPHGMGGWDWQACTEMVMPMSYIEGAHHIDLRPATKEDPDWLVGLRESELEIISGWLSDYYRARGPLFQRAAAKGSATS